MTAAVLVSVFHSRRYKKIEVVPFSPQEKRTTSVKIPVISLLQDTKTIPQNPIYTVIRYAKAGFQ